MSANMVAVLYLLSALLFIFALRGLSHPESSRLGNIFGIIGMIIAIITTLMFKSVLSYAEIGAAIVVGGALIALSIWLNKKGITIILVTHESDIANYGNKIIYMKDGNILQDKI